LHITDITAQAIAFSMPHSYNFSCLIIAKFAGLEKD